LAGKITALRAKTVLNAFTLRRGSKPMSKRVLITLAIVIGIGVGSGAVVFGTMLLLFGSSMDEEATFIASGSTLLMTSLAALVAHIFGCFPDPDDHEP
jgi:hypothetical protein